jgi:Concanavalin A-like lectin/glucanases superfamily
MWVFARFIAVVGITAGLSVSAFALPSGLVAYYPLDGNAVDYSDNGNSGSISGPVWVSGYYGNALHFNGSNDYVMVPDKASLSMINGLTICAWINPEIGNMWYRVVGKSNSSNSDDCWGIGEAMAGGICFTIWKNGSQTYTNGHTPLQMGQWNHIAGTWDGNVMHIYQNGALQSEMCTVSPPIDNSSNPLYLGKLPNNTYYFKGAVDEVMIFNRGLTANEIDSIFRGAYLGKSPVLQPVPSPTTNTRPQLTWSNVPNSQGYVVQLDTLSSCANPIQSYSTLDTSLVVPQPLPAGPIFWRVYTMSHGYSTIGSFFVVDSSVPLIIPYLPKVTLNMRPKLTWHPVSGTTQYTLVVAANSSFENPIIELPLGDTVYAPVADLPTGTILWHVKSDLSSRWSQTDSFTIQSDTIPFLIRFNGITVKNLRPVFAWTRVPGGTSYRIEIADNHLFDNMLTTLVSDTTFTPLADLAPGTWHWRVSCSRDYSAFCVPDSVQLDAPAMAGENRNNLTVPGLLRFGPGCRVSFYSLSGRKLTDIPIPAGCTRYDQLFETSKSLLTSGVYLAVIQNGNRVLSTAKFLCR